jgi:chromosome segregation ATPase
VQGLKEECERLLQRVAWKEEECASSRRDLAADTFSRELQLETLRLAVADAQGELQEARAALQRHGGPEAVQRVVAEKEELACKYDALSAEHRALEGQLSMLKKEGRRGGETSVLELEDARDNLATSLSAKEALLNQERGKVRVLEDKVARLSAFETTAADVQERLTAARVELQGSLSERERQVEALEVKLRAVQGGLSAEKLERVQDQSVVDELSAENARLETVLLDLASEKDRLCLDVEAALVEKARVLQECHALETWKAGLTVALEEAAGETETLKIALEDVMGEKEALKVALEDVMGEKEALKAALDSSRTKEGEARIALERVSAEKDSVQASFEAEVQSHQVAQQQQRVEDVELRVEKKITLQSTSFAETMAKVVPDAQHLRLHDEEALLKRLEDVHFEKERLVEAVEWASKQLQDHVAQSAMQLERLNTRFEEAATECQEKAKTIDSLKAQLASFFCMSAASRGQNLTPLTLTPNP